MMMMNSFSKTCNCGSQIKKEVLKKEGLKKDFFLERINEELSAADTSCKTTLDGVLGEIWDVSQLINGCNFYYNYLYTKLQATQIVMGCYTRDINTKKGSSGANTSGSTVKDENIESQAQSTSSSTTFSDAIGANKFDDQGSAKTTYHSETIGRGWSYDLSEFNMDDKSYGTGDSVTETEGTQKTYRFNKNTSKTEGESSGSNFNSSCKNSIAYQRNRAQGNITPFSVISQSGTRGGSSKQQSDLSAGWKKGFRNGDTTRYINGFTKNHTQTDGTNHSWNQQVIDELGWSRGAFDNWSKSKAHRQMNSHSDGFGTTQDEMRARNAGSAQGTTESKKILNAVVQSSKNGFMVMDDIKAHQRFLHMRQIYLNVELELKDFQKVLRSKQTPQSGKIYAYLGCEKFDSNLWCATCH